jgi:tetratricopeptide (TPR) repeat protein
MGDRDLGEARYRAFLSYSHKDAAAAGRLHRRLEAYRVPRRLAGRETSRGPVPSRLWPIFRDREELPAATDLSETVREALAQSGALIILCSPHAAASLWVAEEIRVFRELHPGRPILAAILEGDPPDCFPDLLRAMGNGHEPLGADLRRDRDGERLGLLKLVAGITGLGLDDLVQRDATRRVRRVMAVTAGAVAAMLVMAVLVVVAVTARQEAERERAEAEGQIEFMLTDLRNRLRTVGRLDIMEAVNARAFRYYEGPDELRGRPPSSELRRARILHAIGEDQLTTGHPEEALISFREAHRTTAELLSRTPDDADCLLGHGRSEYWLGRVHELRGEWVAARRQYLSFADIARRLLARDANNPTYLMEAAWSWVDLGNVALNGDHDPAAAQALYLRAVHGFERALALSPADNNARRRLANAYGWLADSYFLQRRWPEAVAARQKQHDLASLLHQGEPADVENSFRLALAQRGLGRALAARGDRQRARQELFAAHTQALVLTARDPSNDEWLLFRGLLRCDLALLGLGVPEGATLATLRDGVRSDHAALVSQSSPRARELAPCLSALARAR